VEVSAWEPWELKSTSVVLSFFFNELLDLGELLYQLTLAYPDPDLSLTIGHLRVAVGDKTVQTIDKLRYPMGIPYGFRKGIYRMSIFVIHS
jgi:hypothetical protein